jgi:hypothetical protein
VGEQRGVPAGGQPPVHPLDVPLASGGAEHGGGGEAERGEQRDQVEGLGDVGDDKGGAQAVLGGPYRENVAERALACAHHADDVQHLVDRKDLCPGEV